MTTGKTTKAAAQDAGHETIDRAAGALHDTVDRLSDGAKYVDEQVRERAQKAEQKVEAAVADVRLQSEQLLAETTRFVRTNPLLSVGLAVMAGALMHKMLRRR